MPFLYKLIREDRCLSRRIEEWVMGVNSKHPWNFHRITHILVNGTLIGSGAAILLLFFLILRTL